MSTPIGTATSAPTRSSHGLPAEKSSSPNTCPPPLANSTAAHAPTPTKVIWASEIWPDQPIKGTSESMMNAVTQRKPHRSHVGPRDQPDQHEDGDKENGEAEERALDRREARCDDPADPTPLDASLGQEEQREEQDDRRDRLPRRAPASRPGEEVGLERQRETDDHPADVRHRQALEAPDDRGGERVDDQEGQRLDRERRELFGEEDPRERRHRRAEHPRELRRESGTRSVQRRELPVVDHRSHRDSETSAIQQQSDPQREQQTRDHGDHPVVRHERLTDVEAVAPEERTDRPRLVRVPERRREPDEEEHQTDRHDDLRHQWRGREAPHEDTFDERAQEWRCNEHGQQQGDERLDARVDLQLPVDEREQHPHRALREVEDPRCRVGDDESCGRDRVDRSERDADDDEEEERIAGDRSPRPRLLDDVHDERNHGDRRDERRPVLPKPKPFRHGRHEPTTSSLRSR